MTRNRHQGHGGSPRLCLSGYLPEMAAGRCMPPPHASSSTSGTQCGQRGKGTPRNPKSRNAAAHICARRHSEVLGFTLRAEKLPSCLLDLETAPSQSSDRRQRRPFVSRQDSLNAGLCLSHTMQLYKVSMEGQSRHRFSACKLPKVAAWYLDNAFYK